MQTENNDALTRTATAPGRLGSAGTLLLAALAMGFATGPLALDAHSPGKPAATQAGSAQLKWADGPAAASDAPRQRSFDDSNYQPRGAVNRLPPPPGPYWSERAPRYASAEPLLHQAAWEWQGADRKRQKGRFEWLEHNGAIVYGSVCRNYSRGSIPYRECRKGAKAAFARMCADYKPACHAANNFLP